MRRPSSRQRRLVVLILALLAFALAYYAGTRHKQRPRPAPAISGVAIHPPAPLPELPEDQETPLSEASLSGHWSLLMLDPAGAGARSQALVRLLQVHNRLASTPDLQLRLAYLYLSPEMAPERRQAIDRLGDNLHALSGDRQRLEPLFNGFGVDPDGERAALYLIGPETRLHALFTPEQDIATIAEDLTSLITRE